MEEAESRISRDNILGKGDSSSGKANDYTLAESADIAGPKSTLPTPTEMPLRPWSSTTWSEAEAPTGNKDTMAKEQNFIDQKDLIRNKPTEEPKPGIKLSQLSTGWRLIIYWPHSLGADAENNFSSIITVVFTIAVPGLDFWILVHC